MTQVQVTESGSVAYPAAAEALAFDAEKKVLAVSDRRYSDSMAEWKADSDSYKFRCERVGDFLWVLVERNKHLPTPAERHVPIVLEYETTLNLKATTEIKLITGHGVDRNGIVWYEICLRRIGVLRGWDIQPWSKDGPPPKGYEYYARPNGWYIRSPRALFALDTKDLEQYRHMESSKSTNDGALDHFTPDYPRSAMDDRIRFEGIGATIFTPAGLGRGVYNTLMKLL